MADRRCVQLARCPLDPARSSADGRLERARAGASCTRPSTLSMKPPVPRASCDAEGLILIDSIQELDLRMLTRSDDPGRAQTEESYQGSDAQAAGDQQCL